MKKYWIIISLIVVLSLLLAGCNLPGQPKPTSQVDAMNTAAAQTITAQLTNIAKTNQAQAQITPTVTLSPSDENPSASTGTPTPTPTKTAEGDCFQASLVSETIPDGTDFTPEPDLYQNLDPEEHRHL